MAEEVAPGVELLHRAAPINGENPIWSGDELALWWIDTEGAAIHRLALDSGEDRAWPMPSHVGAIALTRRGRVIAALRTGVMLFDPANGSTRRLADPPYDERFFRFNEGKCDAAGRFWIGTMWKPLEGAAVPQPKDSARPLSSFTLAGGLVPHRPRATIANGLAWSPDGRTAYFADSAKGEVRRYRFDPQAPELLDEAPFAHFDASPDGAAVDVEGGYWSALYGGARLVRIMPDGRLEREIALPVQNPTMCAFGGANLDELYVTSATEGLSPQERARQPLAGSIFRVRPGVRGLEVHRFAD